MDVKIDGRDGEGNGQRQEIGGDRRRHMDIETDRWRHGDRQAETERWRWRDGDREVERQRQRGGGEADRLEDFRLLSLGESL